MRQTEYTALSAPPQPVHTNLLLLLFYLISADSSFDCCEGITSTTFCLVYNQTSFYTKESITTKRKRK